MTVTTDDAGSTERIQIVRLSELNSDALELIEEYYDAVEVIARDSAETMRNLLRQDGAGLWLAYLDNRAVGCVLLKALPLIPLAGECKRLYVKPGARGHGIADRLMDALERYAHESGLRWVYLDSYDGLKTAIALYRRRGYVDCERYNDNPQATVFLRKELK